MNRIKIALWKPTHQLIRNSEKLDSKLYCISNIFTDEIQQNDREGFGYIRCNVNRI